MNGLDKGLVLFRGRPLISHVIDRLKPQVHQLWINCNRSHEHYLKLGWPLLTDAEAEYQGPLEGILSMANHFNENTPNPRRIHVDEYCMVVPCDMPFLPLDLVNRLQNDIAEHNAAYASTAYQAQPLVLLLRPRVFETIPDYLKQDGRSVMGWLRNIDAIPVSFTPDSAGENTEKVEIETTLREGGGNAQTYHDKLSLADTIHRSDFSNINDLASLSSLE